MIFLANPSGFYLPRSSLLKIMTTCLRCHFARQFDQRADSAEQCLKFFDASIELQSPYGESLHRVGSELAPDDLAKIKNWVINPVESPMR